MKRIFTLLIASLIAVSLMGQSTIKNTKRAEGQRAETFEILKQITRNNASLANPFYSPNDSKQAMDSLIYEEFHEFDGGWRNDDKYEYYWDESGKEILMIFSGWMVEENYWFNYQKTEYSYDGEGRLSIMKTQQQGAVREWVDAYKTEFTYNGSSAITAIMNIWNQELNQWNKYWKYEYVFDDEGKLLEIVNYYNNEIPENWLNAEKYEYIYDGDGRMLQELWWLWNMENNEYLNEYKIDYVYEGNGNLISETWNYWNNITLEWENESKAEFTYDEHGNISEYLESWWYFDLEDWLVEEKVVYTYNNAFVFSDLILPSDYSGYFFATNAILFNHMLLTEEVFEAWDTEWDEDTRATYYYSEHNSSGIELNNEDWFLVYPNPATDFFTLDLNNGSEPVLVEMYDTQGRIVSSQEVVENQPISVANLNAGVYVYKFVFNNKAFSGKLLVQ